MTEISFTYFPVKDKKPLVDWNEFRTRRPTLDEINDWFNHDYKEFGIPTGKFNGILVLDIDGDDGRKSIVSQDVTMPKTWVSKTKRGWHYYFKWNESLENIPTTKVGLLNHVDIRGEGGYVVQYPWCPGASPNDCELADIPKWLMDLINTREVIEVKNEPGWVTKELKDLGKGNRHYFFSKLIGWYNRNGLSKEDIFSLLSPIAKDADFEISELYKQVSRMCDLYAGQNKIKDIRGISGSELIKNGVSKINWLIDGIMPKEGIGIIAGAPGYGKSWMLLDLAIDLSSRLPWLNKFSTNGHKVMYIDEESSKNLLQYRFTKLLNAKNLTSDETNIAFYIGEGFTFNDENVLDRFKQDINLYSPDVIIIDSLIRVNSAEENNSTAMANTFYKVKAIVKEFHCAVLFADHTRKPNGQDSSPEHQTRGSNEKIAAVDMGIVINRIGNNLLVSSSKSRYTQELKPFEISIIDDGDNKTFVRYIG